MLKGLIRAVGILLFLLLFFSCSGVYLSRFQTGKTATIPIGTGDVCLNIRFAYPMNIEGLGEIQFSGKEILIGDKISGKVKRFTKDGAFISLAASYPTLDPGKFALNVKNECYVENMLPGPSNTGGAAFGIMKFDSSGKFTKDLGILYGRLDSITINDHNDILLVVRSDSEKWGVIRYMNDLLVGNTLLTNLPGITRTNMISSLNTCFPVEQGRLLLLEYEYYAIKNGAYQMTRYYLYDTIAMKVKACVREKSLDRMALVGVDKTKNMRYFKYARKNRLEVVVQNIDYDLKIRKSWAVPFKTRTGFLLSTPIDQDGNLYQIRATKKAIAITQYR